MSSPIAARHALFWWTLTIVLAAIFFALAQSDTVYEVTSPPGPLQIILRKSYSIAAFAIVGFLLSRSFRASGRSKRALYIGAGISIFSLLIEITQSFGLVYEGLAWNAVDVACGFLGGYLGAFAEPVLTFGSSQTSGTDAKNTTAERRKR